MCQAGVEMFEYRLPQSPVENKVLTLTHGAGVPVCKPNRINGHAVEVASLPVGLAAETDINGHSLHQSFKARPRNNLPVTPLQQKGTGPQGKLSTFSTLSRQGMLSRKDRKTRPEKNGLFSADSRMSFEERVKSKFKLKKTVENLEDPDDPYAFPEPTSESVVTPISCHSGSSMGGAVSNNPQTSPSPVDPCSVSQQHSPLSSNSPGNSIGSVVTSSPQAVTVSCGSAHPCISTVLNTITTTSTLLNSTTPSPGTSSMAKLYPELAEKLERVKPRLETKVKGRSQGSNTVNRLQTKIAQNRIKDKLKKTHSQEVTSPQRSPVCTPPQRSPVQQDVNTAISKETFSERLKPETKSTSSLPVSYMLDGASSRSSGSGGGMVAPMPPPPPPFTSFQNLEQLADHVIPSPLTTTSPTASAVEKTDLMPPPPPYPGLQHGGLVMTAVSEHSSNRLGVSPWRTPSSQYPFFPSKVIGCAKSARQPSPAFLASVIPVLQTLPRRPKQVLCEKEARARLKTDSALRFYSQYVCHKINNHHYLPFDVAASDDDEEKSDDEDILPWQQDWFSASSDEEEDEPNDELALHIRTTKLALMRARLRRQYAQSRKSHRSNLSSHTSYNQTALSMIRASRENPTASIKTLSLIHHLKPRKQRLKKQVIKLRPCRHKNDEEVQCTLTALPSANHCQKHIMYNVDQQLFDYCTAKFADNTQCCIPVFDIRHELPLCPEHAAKADNYNKAQGTEQKSRPRKKTRPSALTKPPKKGKKKKNQRRNVRPQKPIPTDEPTGDTEMPQDIDVKEESVEMKDSGSNGESSLPPTPPISPAVDRPTPPVPAPRAPPAVRQPLTKTLAKPFDSDLPGSVLEFPDMSVVNEVMGKSFELPLEQASRLLEDQDLHDVLLPDDAFDIFGGRNADFEPSTEETEALERALAEASQDVKDTWERFSQSMSQSMASGDLTNHFSTSLMGQSLNAAEANHPAAISGNLVGATGQESIQPTPQTTTNGLPLLAAQINKPLSGSPTSHQLFTDQQASYPQSTAAQVSPAIYPTKQYAHTRMPVVNNIVGMNSQSYVPYTSSSGSVAVTDRLRVHGLPMDTQDQSVVSDYNQDRTLRQQLSVTVPHSPLALQRHLHSLAGSPIASSPGRHSSSVVSMASPVPSLGVHSPVQTSSPMPSPMTNSHTVWPAGQISSSTNAPVYTPYHNGFPVNNTAYNFQVPPGALKYSINPGVKLDSPHYLTPSHSIVVAGSQPQTSGFDKGNSGGTKIT